MIGNQPIYIKKWDQQGIKSINDLIHENGEFLSQDEVEHTGQSRYYAPIGVHDSHSRYTRDAH